MTEDEYEGRIARLEMDLGRRDERIEEMRRQHDLDRELVDEMREAFEERNALLDSWIEAFDMQQNADGKLEWMQREWIQDHDRLRADHAKLLADWNRFVGKWNRTVAPRERGRPLDASPAQAKAVLKLRKGGASLRAIAKETGLGLRTVRTIVDKAAGTDRTAKRTNLLRRREVDRLRAANWRARKRTLDALPARIEQSRKCGAELVKAAKGLGRA